MTVPKPHAGALPLASAWEWAQAALLISSVTWTTLCLGGFLAETMIVTSTLTGALLTVHLLERAMRTFPQTAGTGVELPAPHPAGWLLLPFLAYAAANVLWVTPVRWLGWFDWLGWAQMTVVFWVVLNGIRSNGPRSLLFVAVVILGFGLVILAGYQRFVAPDWLPLGRVQAEQFRGRASGSFGAPNSFAAFLLLLLPAVGALTIRKTATATQRLWWAYLTTVFGIGLLLTLSRGAWLALGLVLAVSPLLVVSGTWMRKLSWLAGCWLSLALLGLIVYRTVPAAHERIEHLITQRGELSRPIMWRAAWENFRASPTLGAGAGSYAARFEQHRPENFQLEARWAHNDYLNTLSDYGLVGFSLLFGAGSLVILGCARRVRSPSLHGFDDSAVTFGLGAGLAAFAIQLGVEFSLKIPALAMTFAMVAALFVQRTWTVTAPVLRKVIRPPGRTLSWGMAFGTAAVTWWLVIPLYRGEAKRQHARETVDRMAPGRAEPTAALLVAARDELISATQLSPLNGQAWADLSYVTAVFAGFDVPHGKGLARDAQVAAERALATSPIMAEFWVRKGVALDLQGAWTEAGNSFVQALKLAPARAGIWYQQAFHLSLKPTQRGPALAAAELALRLDPGNPEAHALRKRLAERSHAP